MVFETLLNRYNLISLTQFIATFDKKSDKKVMFGPNKDCGDDSLVCALCSLCVPSLLLSRLSHQFN